jgi:hypothetical protein
MGMATADWAATKERKGRKGRGAEGSGRDARNGGPEACATCGKHSACNLKPALMVGHWSLDIGHWSLTGKLFNHETHEMTRKEETREPET